MPTVELSAGPIDYVDYGDHGPVLVFGHGPPMDHRAWQNIHELLPGYRCVFPTLPLGGHRQPMRPDADLTQAGVARLLAEFLQRLELDEVTVVLNDWGGGQFMITEGVTDRVARFVLASCEAFDNFPPGAAKAFGHAGKVPAAFWLLLQPFRLRSFRQMRAGYGGMSVRGIPDNLLVDWFRPSLTDAAIRRDFAKFSSGSPDRETLLRRFDAMREFDRPVLVVWAADDRLMPPEHGSRLAQLYPNSRLEVLPDCSTLVAFDQPEKFAQLMVNFLTDTGAPPHVR